LTTVAETLSAAAVVGGTLFLFVASVGVLRLRDFYSRIHAPTNAAPLGLASLLVAAAAALWDSSVVTKAVLAMVFIGISAPVGAHILLRAGYRCGVPARKETRRDDYAAVARKDAPCRVDRPPVEDE